MSYQNILVSTQNFITTITVNRPDKLNALNSDTISELGLAVQACQSSDLTRVIIITGAGEKAFVAGADISAFATLSAAQGAALAQQGHDVFNSIERCGKPVIAAINGFALGGGCELAMACHIRIAADSAKFGQPEVKLGLIPGYGGTQRLVHLIGKAKAIELLITADMMTATDALQWGLVNHVVPMGELMTKCHEIAAKIMAQAPLAVAACIKCANDAATPQGFVTEVAQFGECFATADTKEGVAAFMEKRKPIFTGK